MDTQCSLNLIFPKEKFKQWMMSLINFDGDYQFVDLDDDNSVMIEIETDKSISPNEANIHFMVKVNGFTSCTTFRGYVSDIRDMAVNLSAEMDRTDISYGIFQFKYCEKEA